MEIHCLHCLFANSKLKGYRITLSLLLLYAKDSLNIFLSFYPILDRVEGSIVAQLPNLDVWSEPTF